MLELKNLKNYEMMPHLPTIKHKQGILHYEIILH